MSITLPFSRISRVCKPRTRIDVLPYLLVIEPSKRISYTWNVNSKQQRAAKGGTEVQSSVRHGGRGLSLSPQRHAMHMDAGRVLVL